MGTDQIAGTGIDKTGTKRKDEKKTEIGSGDTVGVQNDDTTVKGRIRGEGHPRTKVMRQGVQIETRLESRTEAGAPEARVTGTIARIDHLIEKTKTENPGTERVPRAGMTAVLRAIEKEKGDIGAPVPSGDEQVVPPDPKTEEALEQIVQKTKKETTARGMNPAPAPALTVIESVIVLNE